MQHFVSEFPSIFRTVEQLREMKLLLQELDVPFTTQQMNYMKLVSDLFRNHDTLVKFAELNQIKRIVSLMHPIRAHLLSKLAK